MIEKITLTKIYISDTSKDGKKLSFTSKKNNQQIFYTRIAIQCNQYGTEWLTGMILDPMDVRRAWKEGFEVTISVERKGQYLNFQLPSKLDILEERVAKIETAIQNFPVTTGVTSIQYPYTEEKKTYDDVEEKIDLPF